MGYYANSLNQAVLIPQDTNSYIFLQPAPNGCLDVTQYDYLNFEIAIPTNEYNATVSIGFDIYDVTCTTANRTIWAWVANHAQLVGGWQAVSIPLSPYLDPVASMKFKAMTWVGWTNTGPYFVNGIQFSSCPRIDAALAPGEGVPRPGPPALLPTHIVGWPSPTPAGPTASPVPTGACSTVNIDPNPNSTTINLVGGYEGMGSGGSSYKSTDLTVLNIYPTSETGEFITCK